MWKYKGEELGLEGITGIPARDMDDEEFAQMEGKLAAQFPTQLGALARSGLWVKEEEEKPKATLRAVSTPDKLKEESTVSEGDNNG